VKGNRDIYEMTTALSTMLRYSIKGKDEVTLEEELKIAGACFKIYQGRFPGKFEYEQVCSDELLGVPIPKMILQPIVENALGHGLEPRGKGGILSIRAGMDDCGRLEIVVEDNGVGIEPRHLKRLTAILDRKDSEINDHIGIRNVNNRVRLKYGDSYGLRLYSEQGRGTRVVLTLPSQM